MRRTWGKPPERNQSGGPCCKCQPTVLFLPPRTAVPNDTKRTATCRTDSAPEAPPLPGPSGNGAEPRRLAGPRRHPEPSLRPPVKQGGESYGAAHERARLEAAAWGPAGLALAGRPAATAGRSATFNAGPAGPTRRRRGSPASSSETGQLSEFAGGTGRSYTAVAPTALPPGERSSLCGRGQTRRPLPARRCQGPRILSLAGVPPQHGFGRGGVSVGERRVDWPMRTLGPRMHRRRA